MEQVLLFERRSSKRESKTGEEWRPDNEAWRENVGGKSIGFGDRMDQQQEQQALLKR